MYGDGIYGDMSVLKIDRKREKSCMSATTLFTNKIVIEEILSTLRGFLDFAS